MRNHMIKRIGARYLGDKRAEFCVLAPALEEMSVHIISPSTRLIPLAKNDCGYWSTVVEDIEPGARYFYRFHGKDVPDPASYYQPEDVSGASCLIDHDAFHWNHKNGKDIPL